MIADSLNPKSFEEDDEVELEILELSECNSIPELLSTLGDLLKVPNNRWLLEKSRYFKFGS